MNRKDVGDRLRQAREDSNISRAEAAAKVKIGTTTLQQWEGGTREASLETIESLAALYKVSPQYLIFGKTSISAHPVTPVTQPDNDEYEYIPAYDIAVSAGHGMFSDGVTKANKHLAFRKRWIQARGLNPKCLAVLFTEGDSMVPTVPENAVIVIDRERNKALDGKIYVIRIDDRLYVKRIQWLLSGGLRLISDNKLYEPLDVSKQDMRAMGVEICGQVIHTSYDLPD